LAEGFLGDITLQARYIRGTFDDKPYTLGKYENTRTRAAIAELAANGGAPMGFYTRFADPLARQEIVRYYSFLKRYESLHKAHRPHAEVVLLFPRRAIHQGHLEPLAAFKRLGRQLLDEHVLFDVRPDDAATPEQLAGYRFVVKPADAAVLDSAAREKLSQFSAPQTVRVSANWPADGDELTVHFVNYNRTEPEKKRSAGRGIVDENPIAAPEIAADLVVPAGFRAIAVEVMTPESPEPVRLASRTAGGRVKFTLPSFLVYSVARIQLARAE
jgi:hypothetical protein